MSRANFDKDSMQTEVLRLVVERGVIHINQLHQLLKSDELGIRKKVGIAVAVLDRGGYIMRDCSDGIMPARRGKSVLADMAAQHNHEPARQVALQMAGPRVHFARSPEVLKLSTRPGPIRPGADDWRAIPSRMGDTLRLPTGEVIQG